MDGRFFIHFCILGMLLIDNGEVKGGASQLLYLKVNACERFVYSQLPNAIHSGHRCALKPAHRNRLHYKIFKSRKAMLKNSRHLYRTVLITGPTIIPSWKSAPEMLG